MARAASDVSVFTLVTCCVEWNHECHKSVKSDEETDLADISTGRISGPCDETSDGKASVTCVEQLCWVH